MSGRATDYYRGEVGRRYFEEVYGMTDRARDTVARARAEKIQPWVGPDDTVLEYGVGTGLNLTHLVCARRVGFDVTEHGREACEADDIEFHSDPAAIAGQRFSVVLSHHSLEHVERPLDLLRQVRDRVEPGGRLLLFVPYERGEAYRPDDPHRHLYSWTRRTLGNLVDAAGYEITSIQLRPAGYERRLAPLDRFHSLYIAGLWLARFARPVSELFLRGRRPASVDVGVEETDSRIGDKTMKTSSDDS